METSQDFARKDYPNVMVMLREETAADHQRAEDIAVMKDLQAGTLSRERYLELLENLYCVVSALEAAAVEHPLWRAASGFDYSGRLKSDRLLSDIAFLRGVSPEEAKPAPRAVTLPDISGPARLLGVLYVVEGASLGGRVLLKKLTEHYGYTEGDAASFYGGYGQDTGPYWRAWSGFVENCVKEMNLDRGEMLLAARDMFSCFRDAIAHV